MDHWQLSLYLSYLVSCNNGFCWEIKSTYRAGTISCRLCAMCHLHFVYSLSSLFSFLLGLCLLKLSLQFHFNGKLKNILGMIVSSSFVTFGVFIFTDDLIYNIMEEAGLFN